MLKTKDRVNSTPKDRVNIVQWVKDRVNMTMNRAIFIICLVWYFI